MSDIYQLYNEKSTQMLKDFEQIKGEPLTSLEKSMIDCAFHKGAQAALKVSATYSQDIAEKVKANKIVCHAPGDQCLGCAHYHGRADVCECAPEAA